MPSFVMRFAPTEVRRETMFFTPENAQEIYNNSGHLYERSQSIPCTQTGEDAAEEAFDLTGNPYRQEEREARYGRGQSLSTGDMVEVTDEDGQTETFMCCSLGWAKVN